YVYSENVSNTDYERVMREYAESGVNLIAGKKLAEAAIHAAQNPDSEPIQYIDRPESDYTKFN
ncbi:hypothetical protein N9N65_09905, partial [Amylibacter sp.]|nr:hypothetical protein [Amylibacter sp.]